MNQLIEKARKAEVRKRRQAQVTRDEFEVIVEYVRGRLSLAQVAKALNMDVGTGAMEYRTWRKFCAGIQNGYGRIVVK